MSTESLHHDRTVQQRLYARCGIPEYWILALLEAHVEIYRDPADNGCRTVASRGAGDVVAPVARADAPIVVGDLLP